MSAQHAALPAGRPRERLVEHALALIVQGAMEPPDGATGTRLVLDRWSGQSAEHGAAALEAQRRWDALGGLAGELRARFPVDEMAASKGRQRRQLLLSVAALLGTGVVAGHGVRWYLRQPLVAATYSTRIGELRDIRLADAAPETPDVAGSRLDMAPQSALGLALYRDRRSVRMAHGEVRFEVSRDPARPFEVITRSARIEVLGTAFTVRDRGGPITVGVERGHVRVQPLRPAAAGHGTQPAGPAIDLRPGEALDVGSNGQAGKARRADTAALSAWRDGWLVFDNTRLDDALATINAYRRQPIRSTDVRVDALRLSGRFRVDDSAGLVTVLPAILPLTTRARTDGSVELSLR